MPLLQDNICKSNVFHKDWDDWFSMLVILNKSGGTAGFLWLHASHSQHIIAWFKSTKPVFFRLCQSLESATLNHLAQHPLVGFFVQLYCQQITNFGSAAHVLTFPDQYTTSQSASWCSLWS
uniref:Uncharacterized protein n=1 Tax=Heterosigma akashiwo TaxID=2829 RepID=A0A6V1S5K4_HETAK